MTLEQTTARGDQHISDCINIREDTRIIPDHKEEGNGDQEQSNSTQWTFVYFGGRAVGLISLEVVQCGALSVGGKLQYEISPPESKQVSGEATLEVPCDALPLTDHSEEETVV